MFSHKRDMGEKGKKLKVEIGTTGLWDYREAEARSQRPEVRGQRAGVRDHETTGLRDDWTTRPENIEGRTEDGGQGAEDAGSRDHRLRDYGAWRKRSEVCQHHRT